MAVCCLFEQNGGYHFCKIEKYMKSQKPYTIPHSEKKSDFKSLPPSLFFVFNVILRETEEKL